SSLGSLTPAQRRRSLVCDGRLMSAISPRVSVVIPTCDRLDALRQTLSALANAAVPDGEPLEVLVVDDASTDPLDAELWADLASLHVHLLRQPERRGPAAARNRGARAA